MADAVPFTLRARPEFIEVVDQLARRRGLSRSAFIRMPVQEEALRLAALRKAGERDRG